MSNFKYRPDVDGLRALAVLSVLFYHAGLGFSGGYVGVDVFFVISGFLITSLIRKELVEGTFSLALFWERRVRRIFPALGVMVITCIVVGWFCLLPDDYAEFGRSVWAQAAMGANFHFWSVAGYFDGPSELKPLLHTWSLAVEEQFYLAVPIVLLLLRKKSDTWLRWMFILVALLSFALSVAGTSKWPTATFYLLPTRAWELICGSLLAFIGNSKLLANARGREILSMVSLAAVVWTIFAYTHATTFPGLGAVIPCVGTACIIYANGHGPTLVGRLLSWRPCVAVGLISYSLYLWHWPVLVFARILNVSLEPVWTRFALIAASVILGWLSWLLVETPFRRKKGFSTRKQIFTFVGISTAVLAVCGVLIELNKGVWSRIPPQVAVFARGAQSRPEVEDATMKSVAEGRHFRIGRSTAEAPDFVLWGDSHARSVFPVLERLADTHHALGWCFTKSGTPPLIGGYPLKRGMEAVEYNKKVLEVIQHSSARHVLLTGRWGYYIGDRSETARLKDARPGKRDQEPGLVLRDSLTETVNALRSAGKVVWLLHDVPDPEFEVPAVLAQRTWRGMGLTGVRQTREAHYGKNTRVTEIFDALGGENVFVLDPVPCLSDAEGLCRIELDNRALYYDSNHLTVEGSLCLSPIFDRLFASIK
ncbi:MAG: acyltransferase family protein [Verrucomicrobiota bacterium]